MKVQVLGPGCDRCNTLYQNVVTAVGKLQELAETASVEKVTNPEAFYKYNVSVTPALVVDDEVISMGKVLTPEEVEAELKKHQTGG